MARENNEEREQIPILFFGKYAQKHVRQSRAALELKMTSHSILSPRAAFLA